MPLINAIKKGDLEAIKIMINRSNVNSYIDGDTPLNLAVFFGKIEITNWLIQNGADVNKYGVCSISPLMRAYQNNQIDTARLLLSHGAVMEDLTEVSSGLILCNSLKKHDISLEKFAANLNEYGEINIMGAESSED